MKKYLIVVLTSLLLFGLTSCGQEMQEEATADFADYMVTWGGETEEKPSEMLVDLTEDVIVSLLQDGYAGKRRFEACSFTVQKLERQENMLTMDFDTHVTYTEYAKEKNFVQPVGEMLYEKTMYLPIRLTAEIIGGRIQPDSIFLVARVEENGVEDERSIIEYLPRFEHGEDNTITGEIELNYEKDGKIGIDVERKLWVTETGGYTDNGYFLVDMNSSYGLDVPESCEVSYYADASKRNRLSIEKFTASVDTKGKIYDVKMEDDDIRYIIERYRP